MNIIDYHEKRKASTQLLCSVIGAFDWRTRLNIIAMQFNPDNLLYSSDLNPTSICLFSVLKRIVTYFRAKYKFYRKDRCTAKDFTLIYIKN